MCSAVECGERVTIGLGLKDKYASWKEFLIAQIFIMGLKDFEKYTDWDERELIEQLAEIEDPDDDYWKQAAIDYFGGIEEEE